MLIGNIINLVNVFYIILSVIVIYISAVNKKRRVSISLLYISFLILIFWYLIAYYIPGELWIPGDRDSIGIYILVFLAGIIYLISLIINAVKVIKLPMQEKPERKEILSIALTFLVVFALPAAIVLFGILGQYYMIRNSDAVVIICSRRDTDSIVGLFDNESLGFVIKGDNVHRFDLYLVGGIQKILDDDMVKADGTDGIFKTEPGEYRVIARDEYIRIMRGDELIYDYDTTFGNYYNNEVRESYYRQ
jgi:hypothetical protein